MPYLGIVFFSRALGSSKFLLVLVLACLISAMKPLFASFDARNKFLCYEVEEGLFLNLNEKQFRLEDFLLGYLCSDADFAFYSLCMFVSQLSLFI